MKLKNSVPGNLFVLTGICSLLAGLFFGVFGGLQYVLPNFLKESLSFQQMRPLHVYLVINWIFCAAVGGLYFYLPIVTERKLYSRVLALIHAGLQILILIIVITGYFQNVFGEESILNFNHGLFP
jgi:nitric oxide reductase subunit B